MDQHKPPKKLGRPPSFTTAAELWEKCFMYFEEWKKQQIPLTIMGLCVFLDIGRNTFWSYGNGDYDHIDPDFSDTISRARDRIECDKWEGGLSKKYDARICMFDLQNNHGYKQTVQHVTKDKNGEEMPMTGGTVVVNAVSVEQAIKDFENEL